MRMKREEYYKTIEQAINAYKDGYGKAPSVYELENLTGIPRATLSRYLMLMRDSGMISYSGQRGLMTSEDRFRNEPAVLVPVLGRIACGIPKFAEENIEEYIRLPQKLFGNEEFFMLRADGDSMIGAGIHSDDLVLIRRQNDAEPGQIVVALIDDETATLKRYRPNKESRLIELVPENPDFSVQIIDPEQHSFCIQGVAVKVISDLI